jgi:hypothetical protein
MFVKRLAASYVYVVTSVLVMVCVEAKRLPTTSHGKAKGRLN